MFQKKRRLQKYVEGCAKDWELAGLSGVVPSKRPDLVDSAAPADHHFDGLGRASVKGDGRAALDAQALSLLVVYRFLFTWARWFVEKCLTVAGAKSKPTRACS
jgi:hypothetical protein